MYYIINNILLCEKYVKFSKIKIFLYSVDNDVATRFSLFFFLIFFYDEH